MTVSKSYTYVSPEDYLEGETISPIKHEYIRGEIYGMAGTSKAHDIISLNVLTLLRNHVRGSGCRAYTGNVKVHIEQVNTFYYPDAMVSCDERDNSTLEDYFIRYPRLIVEVLSPSTAAFDRGEKFADYRTLETLREYVLISQDRIRVDCFRRNSEGLWVLYPYAEGEEVRLDSIDFNCAIASLYEDVLGIS
ncbi:Uma2 family endonuclease [Microcoleus sp. FACHB-831]|uniref:Uma2 family endonuclease n=1 Tax=Microcoleus sp. FACHB-831 TaxID=2692827 RepID=UPI0016869C8F|nr:Uma2 family endonuclease [Microcoleus sp. FACHB-831]MBD1920560.1 Uma2 family endonuclease [Microcoleus sp. FACHB-831]